MRSTQRSTTHRPERLIRIFAALTVLGVIALGLSIANAVAISRESDEREAERVAADLAGCERGNVLRGQVVDIAEGTQQLIDGILSSFFDRVDAATAAELRQTLRPKFDAFAETVESIQITDCAAATPGAEPEGEP